ncbi:hypothetical protein PBPRB0057 [Photobacterium profundum SS9]|uniref:Uncharacterized protein n=1 Tax=Photobacterium profundum (strain SS9) TaxID=298386 RepID=Q6LLF2_PHOPR|nr:hypothetical protein PBPRB0057 [Photobacterium profundum SS9]
MLIVYIHSENGIQQANKNDDVYISNLLTNKIILSIQLTVHIWSQKSHQNCKNTLIFNPINSYCRICSTSFRYIEYQIEHLRI